MNAKKLTLALATILACSTLTACGNTDNKLTFNDYWEFNSLAPSSSLEEILQYKVTFEEGDGLTSIPYKLTYGEGSYTTTLKSQGEGYIYTTSLSMPVTFQYGSEEAVSVVDTVQTTVVFENARSGLRPISSSKQVVSHTPVQSGAYDTASCYALYDFSVETTYPKEGKATSTVTYRLKDNEPVVYTSQFNAGGGKFSYVDNEQLLLALRAVSSTTTSGTVKIYNPFVERTQKIKLVFDAEATGKDFTYLFTGASETKTISCREATITIDEQNPGATQTAVIAATSDPAKNTHRNVILKLTTPLSYSFGSLVYELTAITRN